MSILEKVKKALPGLEVLIEAETGLNIKGRLSVEEEPNRYGTVTYRIQSDSMKDMLNEFSALIFEDIVFYFWGGNLNTGTNRIWYSPKVSYSHVHGGRNGCAVLWESLWLDIETGQWITRK